MGRSRDLRFCRSQCGYIHSGLSPECQRSSDPSKRTPGGRCVDKPREDPGTMQPLGCRGLRVRPVPVYRCRVPACSSRIYFVDTAALLRRLCCAFVACRRSRGHMDQSTRHGQRVPLGVVQSGSSARRSGGERLSATPPPSPQFVHSACSRARL